MTNEEIVASINKLNEWKGKVEEDLPEKDRKEIGEFYKRIKIFLSVVGIFGLGGAIISGFSIQYASDKAKESRKITDSAVDEYKLKAKKDLEEVKTQAKEIANDALMGAKREIQDSINSQQLRYDVAMSLKTNLNQELDRQFRDAFSIHAVGLMFGVKSHVENLAFNGTLCPSPKLSPLVLREVVYFLNDLETTYCDDLATGRLPPDRKAALLFCVNGLFDVAKGDEERALQWFHEAVRVSPRFPEAYYFAAWTNLQRKKYDGPGRSDNGDGSQVALELLSSAQRIINGSYLPYARYVDSLQAYVQSVTAPTIETRLESLQSAIECMDKHVAAEKSLFSKTDPRLLAIIGQTEFDRYWASPEKVDDSFRVRGVKAFLEAFTLDPEFLRPLNNYVWFATHAWVDGEAQIVKPLPCVTSNLVAEVNGVKVLQNEILFRDCLDVLCRNPLTKNDIDLLNTVSEAYAALWLLKRDENDAKMACHYARETRRIAKMVAVSKLEIIEKDCQKVEKICQRK